MPPSSTAKHTGPIYIPTNILASTRSPSHRGIKGSLISNGVAWPTLASWGCVKLGWLALGTVSRQPAVPTAPQRPSASPHSYGVTPAVDFTRSHPETSRPPSSSCMSLSLFYVFVVIYVPRFFPQSPLRQTPVCLYEHCKAQPCFLISKYNFFQNSIPNVILFTTLVLVKLYPIISYGITLILRIRCAQTLRVSHK